MRSLRKSLLFTVATLPCVCVGCSTAKQNLNHSGSVLTHADQTTPPTEANRPGATGFTPSVRPASFQVGEYAELVADDAQSAIQLAVPVVVNESELGDSGLTLEAIEQLALANNPAIQQASAESARAAGIRTQVGLKANPNVGYFGEEIGNDGAGGLHGAFVSQMIVRGDKLAWNRQVHGYDVNAMNWEIETQRQRVRTDIRLAFYDALAAQKRLELARDFRNVAEEGVSISKERVDAKVGTRPDILQSEIQLSEVELSIQQAEFELSAALSQLAAISGVNSLGTTTLMGDLYVGRIESDSETAFAKIIATSPQLAAAEARVERARANVQRQKAQPISNLTAQLGAGADSGTGDGFANVQLSLPIPVHNENQGNIRAAQAEYCSAIQNVQRIRQSIRNELARVMKEYKVAEATVHQYEQSILPRAEETLQLMQEARDAGEFDFLRVLTARRAYFDANLKYVAALGRYAQGYAKIQGLLLTGGLSSAVVYSVGDDLRGQALSGQ